MPRVYFYVVDRDFGFAPNPFHGYCTLATCKPVIRRTAQSGDWIIGMGGSRLNATGRCLFLMRLDECLTFDDYWNDSRFRAKRPVRNGSRKMVVGDNIYHRASDGIAWDQEDSHHSLADGSPNLHNVKNDTQTNRILVSHHFLYFGINAPTIPAEILTSIGYKNGRYHRVFEEARCLPLFTWIDHVYGHDYGRVLGDPFDFMHSSKRYSGEDNSIS
jgi:hypothetical protein